MKINPKQKTRYSTSRYQIQHQTKMWFSRFVKYHMLNCELIDYVIKKGILWEWERESSKIRIRFWVPHSRKIHSQSKIQQVVLDFSRCPKIKQTQENKFASLFRAFFECKFNIIFYLFISSLESVLVNLCTTRALFWKLSAGAFYCVLKVLCPTLTAEKLWLFLISFFFWIFTFFRMITTNTIQ